MFGAHTSDYTVLRDTQKQPPEDAGLLNLDGAPEGYWPFNGSLSDVTGNGHNFSVTAGVAQYGPGPTPGTRALFCNFASRFTAATSGDFAALGDVTIEALVMPARTHTGTQAFIATFAGADETSATNAHYSLRLVPQNVTSIFHEHGAGVNDALDSDHVLPIGQWSHFACVRDGSDDKLYINGVNILTTNALTPPDGGGSNVLMVGDFPEATGPYHGSISQLRVYPGVVRTDAQLLDTARRALPPSARP
jgi:hypothetical protein